MYRFCPPATGGYTFEWVGTERERERKERERKRWPAEQIVKWVGGGENGPMEMEMEIGQRDGWMEGRKGVRVAPYAVDRIWGRLVAGFSRASVRSSMLMA